MENPKILILTTSFTHGGAEKHGLLLADYFKNVLNIETEFWAFRKKTGVLSDKAKELGIPTRIIGEPPRFGKYLHKKTAKKEAKKFKSFKPTVIISLNREANLYNAHVGLYTSAKCTVWSIQTANDCENLNEQDKNAIKNISCFISNSEHGRVYMLNKFMLNPENTYFIKNGFERNENSPESDENWDELLGTKTNNFKVGMVAHMEKRKDHETLIGAWKIVVEESVKKGNSPVLLLAGKFGPTTQNLVEETMNNRIFNNVKFLGPIKNVNSFNKYIDLSVMSSNIEGMPNSIVEAMHQSLPVVANDVEGNIEAMGDKNSPYIAKSKNPKDLAEKILLFVNNPELCQTIGEQNKKYALENFKTEKLGEETWNVILNYV